MNEDEDYTFYSFEGYVYREHGVWKPGKPCEIILEMWSKSKQEWVPSVSMYGSFLGEDDNPRYISRASAYLKKDR